MHREYPQFFLEINYATISFNFLKLNWRGNKKREEKKASNFILFSNFPTGNEYLWASMVILKEQFLFQTERSIKKKQ